MNNIINLNISGQSIPMDHSAYKIISEYINWIRIYFSQKVDEIEIIQDFESRIAELLYNKIKEGTDYVTSFHAQNVIDTIGSPEQIAADHGDTFQAYTSHDYSNYNNRNNHYKKLYKDESNKVISGVCSGIGNFYKIDPLIIRILFILMTLAWGTSILIYLILWIVLPSEKNNVIQSEKLIRSTHNKVLGGVASGIARYFNAEPVLIRLLFILPLLGTIFLNIINIFSDADRFFEAGIPISFLLYIFLWICIPKDTKVEKKNDINSNLQSNNNNNLNVRNATIHHSYSIPKDNYPAIERSNIFTTLLKIIAGFFLFIINFILLGLLCAAFAFILGIENIEQNKFPLIELILPQSDDKWLFWLSIITIIAIPLYYAIIGLIRLFSTKNLSLNNITHYILSILFVLGIFNIINMGKSIKDTISHTNSVNEEFILPFTKGKDIILTRDNLFNNDNNQLLYLINDSTYALKNITYEVKQGKDTTLKIIINKKSSGRNFEEAKIYANALQNSYSYDSTEQSITLPTFNIIKKGIPFRFQQTQITIETPSDARVLVKDIPLRYHNSNFHLFNYNVSLASGMKNSEVDSLGYLILNNSKR